MHVCLLTTVYPEKPDKNGNAVDGERRRSECFEVEYAAGDIFRRKSTSHRQVSDDQEGQDDEAQDAHGPWKTDCVNRTNETIPMRHLPDHWDEFPCRDRKHDAAKGSAENSDTPRYPTFLLEPISDDAYQWAEAYPTRQLWNGVTTMQTQETHEEGEGCVLRSVCHAPG